MDTKVGALSKSARPLLLPLGLLACAPATASAKPPAATLSLALTAPLGCYGGSGSVRSADEEPGMSEFLICGGLTATLRAGRFVAGAGVEVNPAMFGTTHSFALGFAGISPSPRDDWRPSLLAEAGSHSISEIGKGFLSDKDDPTGEWSTLFAGGRVGMSGEVWRGSGPAVTLGVWGALRWDLEEGDVSVPRGPPRAFSSGVPQDDKEYRVGGRTILFWVSVGVAFDVSPG